MRFWGDHLRSDSHSRSVAPSALVWPDSECSPLTVCQASRSRRDHSAFANHKMAVAASSRRYHRLTVHQTICVAPSLSRPAVRELISITPVLGGSLFASAITSVKPKVTLRRQFTLAEINVHVLTRCCLSLLRPSNRMAET